VETKISIITVTYNAQSFIKPTLLSILSQSYKDYEHLIVDGCSKDATLEIIKNFNNNKIRLVSEPDNGLYDAMNKAIKLAKGKYIVFINAGDELYDSETLSSVFSRVKDEDFVYGDTVVVGLDGGLRPYHKIKPSQDKISYKSFIEGMVICHQAMIVKREKAALFNQNYKISSDIDWAINTTKACNSFLDTNLTISRFLDGGVSQKNKIKALRERFIILNNHFGFFKTVIQHLKFCKAIIQNRINK
jgi:glycosyltransferase involved in cell wall biosynthesis